MQTQTDDQENVTNRNTAAVLDMARTKAIMFQTEVPQQYWTSNKNQGNRKGRLVFTYLQEQVKPGSRYAQVLRN